MIVGLGSLSVVLIVTLALASNRPARGAAVLSWVTYVLLLLAGTI